MKGGGNWVGVGKKEASGGQGGGGQKSDRKIRQVPREGHSCNGQDSTQELSRILGGLEYQLAWPAETKKREGSPSC